MYVTDAASNMPPDGFSRRASVSEATRAEADAVTSGTRPSGAGPSGSGFDLFRFVKSVLRCKLWILLGALLGGGLATFIAFNTPQRFSSTAQILIDPRDLRVLQNEVTPGGIINDSSTAYLESQARVINSDRIKLRVIESENLTSDPEFGGPPERGNAVQEFMDELLGRSASTRRGEPQVLALEELDKKVYVKRGERTFVIDVVVSSRDSAKAARIANALVQAYFRDLAEVRSEATKRTSTALTGRLAELRDRLRDSEEKVQQFKTVNDISSIGGRPVSEEQLNQGGVLLGQARVRTAEAKARFEQLRTVRPVMLEKGSLPEAITSGTIATLRAQLGGALGREADLVTQLGPSHPQMIAARSQVMDARRQISDELERIVQAARIDYERAQATERSIAQRFTDLKKDNNQNSQSSVQLRELEREAEAHRSVYQAFLLRARESSEMIGVDSSNARIISDAMPASRSNNLPRKFIMLAGLVLGAGLGLLIGLAQVWSRSQRDAHAGSASRNGMAGTGGPEASPRREQLPAQPSAPAFSRMADPARHAPVQPAAGQAMAEAAGGTAPSRRMPSWRKGVDAVKPLSLGEIAEAADMPVLATLPRRAAPGDGGAKASRGWIVPKPELRSVFQDKGFVVDALEHPGSAFARAVDQVLAALPGPDAGESRRIMVVSLTPGSGASMLALNLVLAAARDGEVPLLVDLGRGAATLTQRLAPEAGLGFDDVYDGSAGFVRAALQDEETGIFFLPREKGRMLPPAGIDRARLEKRFISALRRFSPVVIDGAAIGTDPLLSELAQLVDDVVIIARTSDVTSDALALAAKGLGAAAANIRGLVINEG